MLQSDGCMDACTMQRIVMKLQMQQTAPLARSLPRDNGNRSDNQRRKKNPPSWPPAARLIEFSKAKFENDNI
jgi:hypothetical protein